MASSDCLGLPRMASDGLWLTLESIARAVRADARPFGGLQLVLVGDFFQLPPVTKRGPTATPLKFAFEARAWPLCVQRVHQLTQVFRQVMAFEYS